LITLSLWEN